MQDLAARIAKLERSVWSDTDGRIAHWERISTAAGLTSDGHILPPDVSGYIDRTPNPMWRNRAFNGESE